MGLDVYMEGTENDIDVKPLYPDHTWNRTYLRSSYNDAGFNRVAEMLTGRNLYYVLNEVSGEDGEGNILPDWETSQARAEELLTSLKEAAENFPYRCSAVSAFINKEALARDDEQALNIFKEELAKDGSFDEYSNAYGEFFLKEPLQVSALVRGISIIGQPCLYMIYKTDLSYYVQCAEILAKEFVPMGLANAETASLVWSS